LAEQGTHAELLAHDGLYSQLWHEQGGHGAAPGEPAETVPAARLQQVPLFANLPPVVLNDVAQRLRIEHFPAEDVVISRGDIGDKLYIIQHGQADVFASDAVNTQRPLAILKDGDYFGEMALLYDTPRTATIRARTPLDLYSLSKEDLRELVTRVPELRQEIHRTVTERARMLAAT
jgi:ATP-binding cassette subfamily B protein